MSFSQHGRLLALETPLGEDVLLLQRFQGAEGISQLFSFELDLLSEELAIDFSKIIGQPVTVMLLQADGSERPFHGIVSRFRQGGCDARFTHYRAVVVPWLWLLTRTADCRIFQNKSIPEILTAIFDDLGFSDYRLDIQGAYAPRDYCVQYRETDFNFVSRLMEEYGIFYFFVHEHGKHTLVLADSPDAHPACPGQSTARYVGETTSEERDDGVTEWLIEQEFRSGKYALCDYNFETPSTDLGVAVDSTVKVGGNEAFEVYDYPGRYRDRGEGDQLVRLRIEEQEATHVLIRGVGNCRYLASGHRFDLEEHYRSDANQTYTLVQVDHYATLGESYISGDKKSEKEYYQAHFTCTPHSTPFRPAREARKPVVQGPQTAAVVGKSGEDIWVDKYGRVKVQFHWDRQGGNDDNSSCWVRVSQIWAGAGWGAMFIPHVGHEVIVDFLEGDPDRPIITGRVYNAEKMPPLELPANQTKCIIRDHGDNEIVISGASGEQQISILSPFANSQIQLGSCE